MRGAPCQCGGGSHLNGARESLSIRNWLEGRPAPGAAALQAAQSGRPFQEDDDVAGLLCTAGAWRLVPTRRLRRSRPRSGPGFALASLTAPLLPSPSKARQASTLPGRLRNKRRWHVLDRFAAAFGARRMGRCMFREMFRVVENLTALLTTVRIGGHDASPSCMVQGLAASGLPVTSGSPVVHSRTPSRAIRPFVSHDQ